MQYPMNLNLAGRRCIVLGGGSVALRKTRSLLEAEGDILLIAPTVVEGLERLALQGRITWRKETFSKGCLPQGFLFICATDDEQVNQEAIKEAKALGMLVNAPAQPELSDFTVPASLRRGKLLLTISTEQLSPACSRLIRETLEREFPDAFADWLEILSALREEVKHKLPDSKSREQFWRSAMNQEIIALVRMGELEQAEVRIRNAVDCYRAEP